MKTFNFQSIFSPLSFGEGSGVRLFLLASLFLASCGEQSELDQPGITEGETVEVTQEISINVLPIQSVGTATRAANSTPEPGEAIGLTYGSDAATRVQTGSDNMTADEAKISNAYILQFDGTAPTSKLKKKVTLTQAELTGGSPITASFTMTAEQKNRVYVVANCSKTMTEGTTTLADFEAPVVFTPTSTCPNAGLPMSAMQDVGVGDTFDVFQLKSMLAKLKFTCGTAGATLKLKGLPNGYSFFAQPAGDVAIRPTGVTYSTTFTLASGTTYYVPENLGGRAQLSSAMVRCSTFAPVSSMFVEISANSTTYSLYLGDGSASDFNFVGGYSYNITATLYGTSEFDWRVGTLPSGITNLNSNGETANCYIADADKWYSFNGTVMGNGATTPLPLDLKSGTYGYAITPQSLNPVTADVLWETQNTGTAPAHGDIVNNVVHVANGVIYFKSGSTVGNAVIAARDADSKIIWSWHIWRSGTPSAITLKDITDGADFTASGLKLMDRNLGALEATTAATDASIGFYYQWGRKDPFPGGASLTSTGSTDFAKTTNIAFAADQSKSKVSVEAAIASPTTFYNPGDDWCSSRNDNFWGTPMTSIVTINNGAKDNKFNSNKGSKSIYDPCPVGWRVPPAYAFANAAQTTFAQGYNFGGKLTESADLFLSASGCRNYSSGTLNYVGSNGFYWVSSPNAASASYGGLLYFYSSSVNPANNNNRAYGFGVRCSQ